jgi:hypothetical protein
VAPTRTLAHRVLANTLSNLIKKHAQVDTHIHSNTHAYAYNTRTQLQDEHTPQLLTLKIRTIRCTPLGLHGSQARLQRCLRCIFGRIRSGCKLSVYLWHQAPPPFAAWIGVRVVMCRESRPEPPVRSSYMHMYTCMVIFVRKSHSLQSRTIV